MKKKKQKEYTKDLLHAIDEMLQCYYCVWELFLHADFSVVLLRK